MFNRRFSPLFNAEGAMGGGEGASGGEAVSSNSGEGFTSGWGLPKGQQSAPSNQAAANVNPLLEQAPQPQEFDFAGRKIQVNDPAMLNVLKDVHKDYSNLQSTYTQTTNQVKDLQTQNQTFMQLVQNMQAQAQQQPPQQQPEPQAPQAEPEAEDDFMEKFYENPKQAIAAMLDGLFQQKVQPVIEPMQKERAWNEEVQGLTQKYDDFSSMISPMQTLLQEMPQLGQHGLEAVYQLAKRGVPAPQPTPEQLLSDPSFRERVLGDEAIQKQFLSQYANQKQATNQSIPIVMAGQPGGQIASTPETKPTDLRGGTKAWLRSMGG